ncbi:MAG: hypothetical protein LBK26_01800 [Rickettsiales bacterium]|nr:hypothetical protein [Rickettsiales bacterium]
MKKYLLVFVILCCSCAEQNCDIYYGTPDNDGLMHPEQIRKFCPVDKNGILEGVTHKEIFDVDLNNDGKKDRIIRGRFSNMTAHGYTFYEIELHNGEKVADFRTVEGADCFLKAYKFQFEPFILTKASRAWKETWATPTPAKIERYVIVDDKLEKISEVSGGVICDVRELL